MPVNKETLQPRRETLEWWDIIQRVAKECGIQRVVYAVKDDRRIRSLVARVLYAATDNPTSVPDSSAPPGSWILQLWELYESRWPDLVRRDGGL